MDRALGLNWVQDVGARTWSTCRWVTSRSSGRVDMFVRAYACACVHVFVEPLHPPDEPT